MESYGPPYARVNTSLVANLVVTLIISVSMQVTEFLMGLDCAGKHHVFRKQKPILDKRQITLKISTNLMTVFILLLNSKYGLPIIDCVNAGRK